MMDMSNFAIGLVLVVMAVDDFIQFRSSKERRRLYWGLISLTLGLLNIYTNWN